jgi:hypothetical protein
MAACNDMQLPETLTAGMAQGCSGLLSMATTHRGSAAFVRDQYHNQIEIRAVRTLSSSHL